MASPGSTSKPTMSYPPRSDSMSGMGSPSKSLVQPAVPSNDSGAKYFSQRCEPRTNSSELSSTVDDEQATHTEQID